VGDVRNDFRFRFYAFAEPWKVVNGVATLLGRVRVAT
jgi:hypothetical protein